jgi:hypothetical protein
MRKMEKAPGARPELFYFSRIPVDLTALKPIGNVL